MRRALPCALALAALAIPATARGFIFGIAGESGKTPGETCARCHAPVGTPPTVTLAGPATLFTGETQTYSVDIVTGASTTPVGFDVAASDGTIGTVAQDNASQLQSGELTHTSQLAKGKEVRVQFTVTAPATTGTITLFAAGLKADGTDSSGGDNSATATLAINVDVAPPNADLAFSGVDAVSGATPVPGPAQNEARWACSFGDGAAGSLPALAAAALIALAIRRRVRSR